MRKAIVNAVMIAALAGATFGMSTLSLAATMGSCSARMHMVRQTWESMPEGPKKAEIAANYNDANHAQKAHDMAGCLASIEKAEAAIKSGP
jgi:hypothetical protein